MVQLGAQLQQPCAAGGELLVVGPFPRHEEASWALHDAHVAVARGGVQRAQTVSSRLVLATGSALERG
eukprot:4373814-Alexandrium_andersonii.AAC.1